MRDKLWRLLDKTRFEYNYFQEYRQHLEKIRLAVVIATGLISCIVMSLSLAVAVPAIVWNLALLVSGAAALVFDKLMINDKLAALKYFIPELNRLLDSLHTEWIKVNELYDYDEAEIGEIFTRHMTELSLLTEKYLDNLNFPTHGKSVEKASEITRYWAEQLS
jgi:hypothetical protein